MTRPSCAFYLVGLLLHFLGVQATSRLETSFPPEDNDNGITCEGRSPAGQINHLHNSWTREFDSPGGAERKTLSYFCFIEAGATCRRVYDENGLKHELLFDSLYQFRPKVLLDDFYFPESQKQTLKTPLLFTSSRARIPGWLPDGSPDHLMWMIHFCQARCKCHEQSSRRYDLNAPRLKSSEYKRPKDMILEWNFEYTGFLETRSRRPTDIVFEEWADQPRLKSAADRLVSEDIRQTFSWPVTGDPVNRPTCRIDSLPNPYTAQVNGETVVFQTYAQLCLHRYYGGHPLINLAGVCTASESASPSLSRGRTRTLHYPPYLVPPWPIYKSEERVSTYSLQKLCGWVCDCEPPAKKGLAETWSKLKLKIKDIAGQDAYDSRAGISRSAKDRMDRLECNPELPGQASTSSRTCVSDSERSRCSASCQSARDCGEDCSCLAFPAYEDSGSKPGFLAQCVAISRRVGLDSLSGLRPRRLGEAMDPPCPCNQTYVSKKCCDSGDGLVWEAEGLRLGVLIDTMKS